MIHELTINDPRINHQLSIIVFQLLLTNINDNSPATNHYYFFISFQGNERVNSYL